MVKKIIIMAKSFKHRKYCIAGIDYDTGEWIRLVSDDRDNEGAVPIDDVIDTNDVEVEVLDIVRVKILAHVPSKAQRENYRYDSEFAWEIIGHISFRDVVTRYGTTRCEYVFANNYKSQTEDELNGVSLLLLKIENPAVVVKTFPERVSVSLNFKYNGEYYSFLSISDIPVFQHFKSREDGTYHPFGESCYVVFSLTDKYSNDGKYYKMAAQFFEDN